MTSTPPMCELCALHGMDEKSAATTASWNKLGGNAMYTARTAYLCADCYEEGVVHAGLINRNECWMCGSTDHREFDLE